jgi:hypothetical protein
VTGRAATTAALYCGFLALWALGAAPRRREPSRYLLLGAALLEVVLLGGAVVGTWSLLDRSRFPATSVWSGFGSGYGCFPLALPLLGLLHQRSRRPRLGAWQTRTSPNT